jgi:hypothetical protein
MKAKVRLIIMLGTIVIVTSSLLQFGYEIFGHINYANRIATRLEHIEQTYELFAVENADLFKLNHVISRNANGILSIIAIDEIEHAYYFADMQRSNYQVTIDEAYPIDPLLSMHIKYGNLQPNNMEMYIVNENDTTNGIYNTTYGKWETTSSDATILPVVYASTSLDIPLGTIMQAVSQLGNELPRIYKIRITGWLELPQPLPVPNYGVGYGMTAQAEKYTSPIFFTCIPNEKMETVYGSGRALIGISRKYNGTLNRDVLNGEMDILKQVGDVRTIDSLSYMSTIQTRTIYNYLLFIPFIMNIALLLTLIFGTVKAIATIENRNERIGNIIIVSFIILLTSLFTIAESLADNHNMINISFIVLIYSDPYVWIQQPQTTYISYFIVMLMLIFVFGAYILSRKGHHGK